MKTKIIFSILFFLFCTKYLVAQEKYNHINFNIFIDEKFIISGINNGKIIINDSLNNINDTITFKYEAGDMSVLENDYNNILKASIYVKYNILFSFKNICSNSSEVFKYEKAWIGNLFDINNRYIIFSIYNFENKTNHKSFSQKNGYGVEIKIPSYSSILPRKKSKGKFCW